MLGPDNVNYTIVAQSDSRFAVQITRPHALPRLVEGFASAEDAQSWIDETVIETPTFDPTQPDGFHTFRNR